MNIFQFGNLVMWCNLTAINASPLSAWMPAWPLHSISMLAFCCILYRAGNGVEMLKGKCAVHFATLTASDSSTVVATVSLHDYMTQLLLQPLQCIRHVRPDLMKTCMMWFQHRQCIAVQLGLWVQKFPRGNVRKFTPIFQEIFS